MTDRERMIFEALAMRAGIYRTRQSETPDDSRMSYNRHDVFEQKAEALELAIYEAMQAAGFEAAPPKWFA